MLQSRFNRISLQFIQIIVCLGCFITYLQLPNGLGLIFAFFTGWILGDFLQTLDKTKIK